MIGVLTGMMGLITTRVQERTRKALIGAPAVWFVAAAGSMMHGAASRLSVTAAVPATATATWASASPGQLLLALDPLYTWQQVHIGSYSCRAYSKIMYATQSSDVRGANSRRSEAGGVRAD